MKNILILNISRLPAMSAVCDYRSDEGLISGEYTNDAPAKYILKKLISSGKSLDRIICIRTAEAETAFEKYTKMIEDSCSEYGCSVPEIVPVDGNYEGTNISSVVRSVLDYIENDDRIYLDTTGGARNSSYLLMFITRFLEYEGIKLEKAVYSLHDPQQPSNNKISDVTTLYSMFDLINAANTFTSFGNADELAAIFSDTKNEHIRDVIDALREFSDGVMLCQTNLSDVVEKLSRSLMSVSSDSNTDDPREVMFCRIVDVIRRKFNITDTKPEIDYPDIIRWCLENNLIQQAVTIYSEKIPEYLFRKKYIIPSESIIDQYQKNNSCYSAEYQMFYHGFAVTMSETHIIKVIEKILRNNELLEILTKADTFNCLIMNNDMRKLIQRGGSAQLQKDMIMLFRIKKAMFTNGGQRLSDDQMRRNFSQDPKIKGLWNVTSLKAGNFSAFIKDIKVHPDIQKLMFSQTSGQKYVMSHLEEMLSENDDYSISGEITAAHMQEILNDCMYIKKWIRNVVNHAADDGNSNMKKYFESMGYNVSDSFRITDIKKILSDALNRLIL